MLRNAVTITLTASILSVAGAAHAASPCTSEYVKFREFFDKNSAQIAKFTCNLVNGKDPAAAQRCVDDFNKIAQKASDLIVKANQATGDSNLTIGPRSLGEGVWRTGALQAQRTWVGVNVASDTYRVQMERTGGKAKSTVSGTVCFLDEKGDAVKTGNFTVNPGQPIFDQTFTDVAGLLPVVLLSMPLEPFNAHQYKISGTRGGVPQAVIDAQQIVGGPLTLKFSYAGPIAGMACTRLVEDADPAGTWSDNYLCASREIGLRWSFAGPLAGMRCTQVNEPAEPASTGWGDNFLCVPASSPVNLQWSYAGPIGGKTCVAWNEPADPHTWTDNFACY